MAKQRKVKLTITLEHTITDDWYEGEGKTPKQKLRAYEGAFRDIESLSNHILSEMKHSWNVQAEYLP